MSVWMSTRNTSDPDVIQAIKDYNDLLSLEPEDQQHLATIKDKIFHRICGQDGHGYCRTFGASVPPRMVNQGSSMSTNNESMLRQMLQQLEQNIKDHVENRIQDLRAEFVGGCTDRVTSQSQAQTSGHRRESIGDEAIIFSTDEGALNIPVEGEATELSKGGPQQAAE